MAEIKKIVTWDGFFYYGKNTLDKEIESELVQLLLQPKRSLYYDRREGCGIADYENYPNTFFVQVQGAYDVVTAVSWKNTQVVNGSNNQKDRRVAVSQNAVAFERTGKNTEELNVTVLYIPLFNYSKYSVLNIRGNQ